MEKVSVLRLEEAILRACSRETSSDPENWSSKNPTWGHCAVVACMVQEMCGGDLLRFDLTLFPKFAAMRSHYKNRLPKGTVVDFTAGQFGNALEYFLLVNPTVRRREEVLDQEKYPDSVRRYNLFRERFFEALKQII